MCLKDESDSPLASYLRHCVLADPATFACILG